MRPFWKRALGRTIRAMAFLGLLLAGLLGAAAYFCRDEPPPADADLTEYRRVVPPEENGFGAIDFKEGEVEWPIEYDHLLEDRQPFDVQLARKALVEAEPVLHRLERSLAYPDFQVPLTALGRLHDPIREWFLAANFVLCRSRLLFAEGKEKEAFAESSKLARFARRIQEDGGDRSYLRLGVAMQALATRQTITMARRSTLAVEEIRPLMAELERIGPSREGLCDALRAEYTYTSELLDTPSVWCMLGAPRLFSKTVGQIGLVRRTYFRPNRWRRQLGEDIRALIAASSKPHVDERPIRFAVKYGNPSFFFRAGECGNSWISQLGSMGYLLVRHRVAEFQNAAARTLLAIKAYENTHGRLPASLADLVPHFLEEIPQDPFDWKPLRYSPEKKVIYSVGEDLADSGGSDGEDTLAFDDRMEPTLRIEAPGP